MTLKNFYDHFFKLFSVFASTLTFYLTAVKWLTFTSTMVAGGVGGLLGFAFGVYIAFVVYPEFQRKGNILGMVAVGLFMTTFYVAPAVNVYNYYVDNILESDAVYQTLLIDKQNTVYSKEAEQKAKKTLFTIKKSSTAEIEQVETDLKKHLLPVAKEKFLATALTNLEKIKWKNKQKKILASDGKYKGIWTALQQKGYHISGIDSVALAQYQEKTKELKNTISSLENLTDQESLAQAQAQAQAQSIEAIANKQNQIQEEINSHIAAAKASLGWSLNDLKHVLFYLGILVEILFNSLSFWLATMHGFLARYNLLSTAHLEVQGINADDINRDEPMKTLHELVSTICDTDYMLKTMKQLGAVHKEGSRYAGKPLLINQTLVGIVLATIHQKEQDFTKPTWEEVYRFMKQGESVPILIDGKTKRYTTLGGHPKGKLKEARKLLSGLNPQDLTPSKLFDLMEKQ